MPVVISNASTPLIGVVDTAVVGQIPDPAYIGAAARRRAAGRHLAGKHGSTEQLNIIFLHRTAFE